MARRRGLLGSTALSRIGAMVATLSLLANTAEALPQNGTVAGGQATIVQTSPTQLTINQGSNRAVIDWKSFSIGTGESTVFNQPGSNSVAVNRVTGADPSQILGHLTANGQVVIVNPNGILFDKTAQVNVGGLVASTSGISTVNAMSGHMVFDQSSNSSHATVVNRGTITAAQGGLVALVAPGVANSGTITANLGKVSLASGDKWTLDLYGDHLVNFAVNDQVASEVTGPDGTGVGVSHTGSVFASGGTVELSANVAKGIVSNAINMNGVIEASSVTSQGGTIILSGGDSGVAIGGTASANGTSGGTIAVSGDTVTHQGALHANGTAGAGGTVTVTAANGYLDTENAVTSATGTGNGGTIAISGGTSLYSAGHHSAASTHAAGGSVTMTAQAVNLIGANINASGFAQGGSISVGGGLHGGGAVAHAVTTYVGSGAVLNASATGTGNGGVIAIWSSQDTAFAGYASARGGFSFGNGGIIEVSSAGTDTVGGNADAGATNGVAGQFLLDPKAIVVDASSGQFPQFDFVDPNASAGSTFGSISVALASGNVVITDPTATIGLGPLGAGAAYLFNGMTGQLISVLDGSHLGDHVGANVTTLVNGNYVVSESTWNGGRGAATFASGTLGVGGTVSAANSLVGSSIGDQVGLHVTALANGSYVVGSPEWDGTIGAATLGSGATGISGAVTSVNSLVGAAAGDQVGLHVTALANGNYVVGSPDWQGSKGAATWGDGTLGVQGTVTASNSLTGGNAGDQVGLHVTALASGDYVVGSPDWSDGKGAATWGDGTVGIHGAVSAANSLVGSAAGDEVGLAVTALTNGNYVVGSPDWSGTIGAATFGNGSAGVDGTVSAVNSLVGSTLGDQIGLSVTALADGSYVVGSPDWDGTLGAATFGDGSAGIHGSISTANSLVGGSLGDKVGLNVTALAGGGYVVGSPDWDGGKGAATFGSGSVGVAGAVGVSNSLLGNMTGDQVGLSVTALSNGNYVVASPDWHGGIGAVTWAAADGLSGKVTALNSLTGSVVGDQVGTSVTALADGDYVVGSPNWSLGKGAATWLDGTASFSGTVGITNSLVGSATGDLVGSAVTAVGTAGYVVSSASFGADLGAATYGAGGVALTGTVNAQNSILGRGVLGTLSLGVAANTAGNGLLVSFSTAGTGRVSEALLGTGGLDYVQNQNGTVTVTPGFLTQTLDNGTAVVLQANDDITINSPVVTSAGGHGGDLTLEAGRSVLLNADISTDNGNLTVIANDTAADGVVDAERDAGNAVIAMGSGATVNAGSGSVTINTKTGAGITNAASGGITLNGITAGTIDVVDETGKTLTLDGQLQASGAGADIVLASGILDNAFGGAALNVGAGHFVLFSNDPGQNTLDGIGGFLKHYGVSYDSTSLGIYSGGGDYSLYAVTPTLTITASNQAGTVGGQTPAFTFSDTGLIDGDTIGMALNAAPVTTSNAGSSSVAGTYTISFSNAPYSVIGYNLVLQNGTYTIGASLGGSSGGSSGGGSSSGGSSGGGSSGGSSGGGSSSGGSSGGGSSSGGSSGGGSSGGSSGGGSSSGGSSGGGSSSGGSSGGGSSSGGSSGGGSSSGGSSGGGSSSGGSSGGGSSSGGSSGGGSSSGGSSGGGSSSGGSSGGGSSSGGSSGGGSSSGGYSDGGLPLGGSGGGSGSNPVTVQPVTGGTGGGQPVTEVDQNQVSTMDRQAGVGSNYLWYMDPDGRLTVTPTPTGSTVATLTNSAAATAELQLVSQMSVNFGQLAFAGEAQGQSQPVCLKTTAPAPSGSKLATVTTSVVADDNTTCVAPLMFDGF